MTPINHERNSNAMTGHKVLIFASYLILVIGLVSCASFPSHPQTTQISSIPVQDITNAYRIIPQRFERKEDKINWLEEVNEFYPDGFLRVGFTTDDDLEKIIIDKVFIAFSYHLNLCETDDKAGLPIYGSEIFRSNSEPINTSDPYYIFIPINLDAAISSTVGAAETLASGNIKLPSDLQDLCVSIGARKSLGGAIKLDLGSIRNLQKFK